MQLQNFPSNSNQQLSQDIDNQTIIEYVLSQPEMINELLRRLGILHISCATIPAQQEQLKHPQLQGNYQSEQISFQCQQPLSFTPCQINSLNQRESPQTQFQVLQQSSSLPLQQQQRACDEQYSLQLVSPPMTLSQPNNGNQYQSISSNDTRRASLESSTLTNMVDLCEEILHNPFDS